MILYLLKYYLETKLFYILPQNTIEQIQVKRIRKLFEWSKVNSAFYKKVYSDTGVLDLKIKTLDDVQKIPIVDKDMLMSFETEQVLATPFSDKLAVNSSSGSTGKPMAVYSTKKEHFTSYIRTFLALKGYNPFKRFVLIGLYHQKEQNEKYSFLYYCQKYLGLFRREVFSVFTPPNEIREKLGDSKINILSSTPSCVKMLVDELKKSGEKLSIKYVVVSGETVFDDFREEVKKYLQAEIINVYGSSELLSMAWTKPNGELFRYNKNSVYVEYVNPIKINDEIYAELVITNLLNRTMPFVRYNIRDHVKLTESNNKMGKVIGRIEDIVEVGNGEKLYRLQLCSMYKPLRECKQFKIIKKKDQKIYFQTICKPHMDKKKVEEKILRIWKEYIEDCPLEVEFLDDLPINHKTGKFKIIEVEN